MNVVIIGCGLIGRKRALALSSEDKLMACCDVDINIAKKFGGEFGVPYFTDYKILLDNTECESVIVSVVNKYAKDIIIESITRGKNVLAEKPLGRNLEEAREIVEEIRDQRSEIRGRKSEVGDRENQRSEIRSRRSEIRDQRSEIRSQKSEAKDSDIEDGV